MAVADEFKIQPVGVDQVGQALFVAFLLRLAVIGGGEFAHVLADVLGLAPADRHITPVEHEIRRANVGKVFRFIDDGQGRVD